MTKVLITGCFDLLHSGHIKFIHNALQYGDELYIGICSDENYKSTKGKLPIFNQKERKLLLENIQGVAKVYVNAGAGKMDFENVIQAVKPDILVVNTDGDTKEKRDICKLYNIKYIVLERDTEDGYPVRSSSAIKKELSK